MNEVQQAGHFRGRITEYGLFEADSGAIAVRIVVAIEGIFYDGDWCDYREHQLVSSGFLWVVKKDGKPIKGQVESLIKHAGWDGTFDSIQKQTWQPSPVSVTVNPNTYKGETTYRIEWINDFSNIPGGGNVSADKAKSLDTRLGSQIRAMAGNADRNSAPAPNGSPAKPEPVTQATTADDPTF